MPQESIADRYRHSGIYLDSITDPEVYSQYDTATKVIYGSVNTKSGERILSRIAVRTVGVHDEHKLYIATIDREQNIEDVEIPPAPPTPEVPQVKPQPDPSVVEKIHKQSLTRPNRGGKAI